MLGHSDGLLSGMCGLFFVCLFVVVLFCFFVFVLGGGGGETYTLSESIRYLPSTVDSVGHSR